LGQILSPRDDLLLLEEEKQKNLSVRAALSLAFHPLSLSSNVFRTFLFSIIGDRRKRGRKREGRRRPLPWRNPFARISRLFFVRLPSNNALTPHYYFFPLRHSFRARAEAERR
jgi:hypothetical protein